MIEIDIPSIDPIQHEPKVFLGMSSRQIMCIVPGVVAAAAAFALLYKPDGIDASIIASALCIAPAVAFGWYKPYNMKFEDYLRLLYFNNFVSNPKRIYKTDSAEDPKVISLKERKAEEEAAKEKNLESKKKKFKKV